MRCETCDRALSMRFGDYLRHRHMLGAVVCPDCRNSTPPAPDTRAKA